MQSKQIHHLNNFLYYISYTIAIVRNLKLDSKYSLKNVCSFIKLTILMVFFTQQQCIIKNFLVCLHFETSSVLLLMEVGLLMVKSFSVKHKLHVLAPGLYDWHFVSICQFIVYFILALLSLHMCFDNSVEVLWASFLHL